MNTLKNFIEQSHISAKLIRAVVRQIGGWDEFKECASDVANYGADGGFSGFIYFEDTTEFYARNRADIVELARQMADDLGEGLVEMVEGFNCLKGYCEGEEVGNTLYGNKSTHDTQVANALAWFALEEVARSYCDLSDR